jgi:hypothetical protein
MRHRLPSIYSQRVYPTNDGLMSYGVVITEPYRQAATYVDRILKGTSPADLPTQAATKFELVISLKDRKGDRRDHPGDAASARQRGDRMRRGDLRLRAYAYG